MRTTATAEFLLRLSSIVTTLFTQVSIVKSVHVINIDRVLPHFASNHQRNIVSDAKQQLQTTKNSKNFTSKLGFVEAKKPDIHSIEGKNFITNEIIPHDLDTDRTFKIFGNSFSHVLKNGQNMLENNM